jgi:hypothetical protein
MSMLQIRDWLDRHPEALPRTLADLARYPMEFRRVMVNVVAPETRAGLWREHFESFLQPDSSLTEPQRQLLRETIPHLPQLLAAPAPNPTMSEWEQRVAAVFTRQEAARLFMSIGPLEPPDGIPLPPSAVPGRTV